MCHSWSWSTSSHALHLSHGRPLTRRFQTSSSVRHHPSTPTLERSIHHPVSPRYLRLRQLRNALGAFLRSEEVFTPSLVNPLRNVSYVLSSRVDGCIFGSTYAFISFCEICAELCESFRCYGLTMMLDYDFSYSLLTSGYKTVLRP